MTVVWQTLSRSNSSCRPSWHSLGRISSSLSASSPVQISHSGTVISPTTTPLIVWMLVGLQHEACRDPQLYEMRWTMDIYTVYCKTLIFRVHLIFPNFTSSIKIAKYWRKFGLPVTKYRTFGTLFCRVGLYTLRKRQIKMQRNSYHTKLPS